MHGEGIEAKLARARQGGVDSLTRYEPVGAPSLGKRVRRAIGKGLGAAVVAFTLGGVASSAKAAMPEANVNPVNYERAPIVETIGGSDPYGSHAEMLGAKSTERNDPLLAVSESFDGDGGAPVVTKFFPVPGGSIGYRVEETMCGPSNCSPEPQNWLSGAVTPAYVQAEGPAPVELGAFVSRSSDTSLVSGPGDFHALSFETTLPVGAGNQAVTTNVTGTASTAELVSDRYPDDFARVNLDGVSPETVYGAEILASTLGARSLNGSDLEMLIDVTGDEQHRVRLFEENGTLVFDASFLTPIDNNGNLGDVMYQVDFKDGVDVWCYTPADLDGPVNADREFLTTSGVLDMRELLDPTGSWANAYGLCAPGDTTLCFGDGQFMGKIDGVDHKGKPFVGHRVPTTNTEDSGTFYYFSPNNTEILVKVLDGRRLNERVWVFSAATTDVQYTLRVTDTATGQFVEYFNALGNAAAAVTDTSAFARSMNDNAPGNCSESQTARCLQEDRYKVEVSWLDHKGNTGVGRVSEGVSRDSQAAWFFSPENIEWIGKVLDACGPNGNGHNWVFTAATTDTQYTAHVTHMPSATTNEYFNPLGNAAAAVTDTSAFAVCDYRATQAAQNAMSGTPAEGDAEVGERSGSPRALTPAEVNGMQEQLGELARRAWAELPNDPGRSTAIVLTYADTSGDFLWRANSDQFSDTLRVVADAPETTMYMNTSRLASMDEASNVMTPEFGVQRQDFATYDVGAGNVALLDFYIDPENDGPVVYDSSSPAAADAIKVSNSSDVTDGYASAETRDMEHVVEQAVAFQRGKISQEDIDVMYVLSRVAGGVYDGYEERHKVVKISRGEGVDVPIVSETGIPLGEGNEYLLDVEYRDINGVKAPDHLRARLIVGVDPDTCMIQNWAKMDVLDYEISPGGVFGALSMRPPPGEGQMFGYVPSQGYYAVSNGASFQEAFIRFDDILPDIGGQPHPLRTLNSCR